MREGVSDGRRRGGFTKGEAFVGGASNGGGGTTGARGAVEATLTEDARLDAFPGRATQLRMTGVGGDGRPVRIAYAIPEGADASMDETLGRLRVGTPVSANGEWVSSREGVATMRASAVAERPMPGEAAGPELVSLGAREREAGRDEERARTAGERAKAEKTKAERAKAEKAAKAAKQGSAVSTVRQGLAQVVGSALNHHENEPEHLAAIQKHATTFMGAIKGAGGATRQSYARARDKVVSRREEAAKEATGGTTAGGGAREDGPRPARSTTRAPARRDIER